MLRVERGELLDRLPYVRVGDEPRTLVVFPGIDDAMFSGRYPVSFGWTLAWYFGRFVDDYEVVLISRPRGLPESSRIGDMAEEYADALESDLGPADVLGVSMGGMIGQELAVRHPGLVDRLVLANTGCRIADLDALDRFDRYARNRDWASIRAELAAAMFSDWRAVSYPPLAVTVGRFVQPRPADPIDVPVSLAAIRAFDSRDRLGEIEAPTLLFGGSEDPYFPEPILEETAEAITDAELEIVEGAKHAAFHQAKTTFDARVLSFLEATPTKAAAQ